MKVHKLRARLASAKAALRLHLLSGTRAGRTRVLFLVLITLLLMAVSPPLPAPKIIHGWVLTDQPTPKLEKILV
jgi:hypothetical protein